MTRSEETLRQIIREEVLAEAPSIDSYRKGPGIVVSRLGGWSHIPQEQGTAPTRSGLWAFIFPHFEPFLVGSTDHAGITSGTKRPSRYELMKSNKRADPSLALKHARYVGSLDDSYDEEELLGRQADPQSDRPEGDQLLEGRVRGLHPEGRGPIHLKPSRKPSQPALAELSD